MDHATVISLETHRDSGEDNAQSKTGHTISEELANAIELLIQRLRDSNPLSQPG